MNTLKLSKNIVEKDLQATVNMDLGGGERH